MVVSLRRNLVAILLALALLGGLLGWTMKAIASPAAPPSYPHFGTHSIGIGFIPKPHCLPPPIEC